MTIHFDDTAKVYELFDAAHNWLGCFDTYQEACDARRGATPPDRQAVLDDYYEAEKADAQSGREEEEEEEAR